VTVSYAPPLTGSSTFGSEREVREVVDSGPAYIRTRTSTRWHRIRSCYHVLQEWDDEIQTRWSYWCGQITGTYRQPITTDEPPTAEPRCGTCEGRFAGWVRDHGWLFTPRTLTPPKLCPGSQTRWVELHQGDRAGRCLVCHDVVAMRGFGGAYRWDWGAQKHPPGEGLVPGCPFHGWKSLRLHNGAVVCDCEVARA
jgi:hypothetical protein